MIPCVTPPGVVFDDSPSPDIQIIKLYDIQTLISFGWVFSQGSGPVWHMTLGLSLVVGFTVGISFVQCHEEADFFDGCIPLPSTLSAMTLFQPTALILAFFVSICLTRWWQVREHLGLCFGRSGAAVIHFCAAVPGHDAESRMLRHTLCRLLNIAHIAIYRSAQIPPPERKDYDDLLKENLITPEELDIWLDHVPRHRPTVTYGWIDVLLNHAAEKGLMRNTIENMQTLQGDVNFIRTQCSEVFTYVQTPIPYSYQWLVVITVRVFYIQLMCVCAGYMGHSYHTRAYARIFTGILTCSMNYFTMERLLMMYNILSNPLGEEESDFPKFTYQKVTKKTTEYFRDKLIQGEQPASVNAFNKRTAQEVEVHLLSVQAAEKEKEAEKQSGNKKVEDSPVGSAAPATAAPSITTQTLQLRPGMSQVLADSLNNSGLPADMQHRVPGEGEAMELGGNVDARNLRRRSGGGGDASFGSPRQQETREWERRPLWPSDGSPGGGGGRWGDAEIPGTGGRYDDERGGAGQIYRDINRERVGGYGGGGRVADLPASLWDDRKHVY
uniref:Bestrophin homolog n=1 Tax=Chromera velia CCMP2878 TaxID=1169474 RepID=A0A0G4HNY2_9ALVE|eukprot:Cvel_7702.t1-p1 / transcript=Cvel_7702.t1 / gene=Cvel_7702 / organism=Chromera_velia_CCMP2878 / gene_product=Bestrophin-3, putative / transcript_product=Bestrophin-3, putative / location=Cvel_scaffold409:27178-29756(+) / protein_length=553 / sequence_SO=supercontig / SO=protein_coding / is_pseudo=false